MDSIKCEAFLTAVEQGSLTAAAELMGYTQPGITRMIRALEEELGFTLLVRSKQGVVPTDNGRSMMPLFRDLVRASHSAEEVGSEIRGMLQGTLTIGSYFSVSSRILPPILKAFGQQYPNVKIRLLEGGNTEFAQWISEKSVDFCFSAKQDGGLRCDWIPLLQDELMVWLPADHPMATGQVFPVEQLEGAPFIITMPDEDTDIDRLLSRYQLQPDIRFSTADAYTTFCMVEAGLGISFNQSLIFQNWRGRVAALPFDPPQYVELGLLVPDLKEASPAAKKFMEMIQQSLKK